jgi:HEPN domain-containing protein/predicted nucleotidyltransferase
MPLMKTDVSHLPESDREALRRITERIREAVPAEMVILFGSYARGDWVVDSYKENGVIYEYISDYDILVVVPTVKDAGKKGRIRLDEMVERDVENAVRTTKVNAIAHDIEFLNRKLEEGHYFFSDVVKEGVLLHDSGRFTLAEPRELAPEERRKITEEDFEHWFQSADSFLIDFGNAFERADYPKAAFELHQATERFYSAILLVFTGYKPKTHDLKRLDSRATLHVPEVMRVFPRVMPEERERFKRLRKAYVDARYKKTYEITREDLEYLGARVRELKVLTETACRKKIESYTSS